MRRHPVRCSECDERGDVPFAGELFCERCALENLVWALIREADPTFREEVLVPAAQLPEAEVVPLVAVSAAPGDVISISS